MLSLVVSVNVNASIINTLNGTTYEWLELTETAEMSRNEVETQLLDINSPLYGYEYASRSLVEDLFMSYSSWDGLDGYHGANNVIDGVRNYFDDFGWMYTQNPNLRTTETVDGYTAVINRGVEATAFYGTPDECGDLTCIAIMQMYIDENDVTTTALQGGRYGWDSSMPTGNPSSQDYVAAVDYDRITINSGSHLVKISSVPVPPAVWLFGSGLIGLIGFAKRKVS